MDFRCRFGVVIRGRDGNVLLNRQIIVGLGMPDGTVQDFGVPFTGHLKTNLQGEIVVKRTGVGLFVVNTQLWQDVQNDARFHLQLASQLIDSNLAHR